MHNLEFECKLTMALEETSSPGVSIGGSRDDDATNFDNTEH